MAKVAKVLYENGADWQYATGTSISDPALWCQSPNGQTHIVVSDLEVGLMKQTARVNHVHSFTDIKKSNPDQPVNLAAMIRHALGGEHPDALEVPATFPARVLEKLRAEGFTVSVADELFFPTRATKSRDEIAKLRAAQKLNEKCFRRAIAILKQSTIQSDGTLAWRKKTLTAEMIQNEMRITAVKQSATEFAGGPIVACGAQGAYPHERGHGVLRANELIVIDSFPRHPNGYWGDLTRTYIKGKPSDWQRRLYNAVLAAQNVALSQLKAGADGNAVHSAVAKSLEDSGFKTGMASGTPYGFFHGTGHSVGLELHDAGPRTISSVPCILKPGYVTSVEPGLYYPPGTHPGGVGGCRIEDVVTITRSGIKNLTTLSKTDWIIP